MNDKVFYPWPPFSDPEGDIESVVVDIVTNYDQINIPVTPIYSNSFGIIQTDLTGVWAESTKFSQVGTTRFLIAVRDGEPKVTYYPL